MFDLVSTCFTQFTRKILKARIFGFRKIPGCYSMCARFQANPKETHLIVIKRILRYLKHTPSIGLWYPKGAIFELVGYSDSDMPVAKLIERAHPEDAICLVDHLCLGPPKNKIVWLCPLPKRNTLPRVLVVHKFYTRNKLC